LSAVLIVEDNDVNRELLREFVEELGHEVNEAHDGKTALAQISEDPPDLVLLDIQMPEMDGYEVIRQLRQEARFQDLKVVALTAYAMIGDKEKALQAGFTAYLTKPIDGKKAELTIRELLATSDKAVPV
jgi:two-component system sensor histidine kinase/response regulator